MSHRSLPPPPRPLGDGTIVLRLRRAEDVPGIARASHDPETRRWLDDPPMGPDEERTALARAEERWRSGRGAPFVIADAATDAALGLVNLQLGEEEDVAGSGVSVFPEARGRGVASRALRLIAARACSARTARRTGGGTTA
jgi:RimJ/RimL family protein N-acetyltransferase